MTSVPFALIPGQPDVQFRFTIRTARDLDQASHAGIQVMLKNGQTTDAIVKMTCYGLRHVMPRITEDKAIDYIQAYVENGGDTTLLFTALFKALQESGVYGKAAAGDEANPTTETPMPEKATA